MVVKMLIFRYPEIIRKQYGGKLELLTQDETEKHGSNIHNGACGEGADSPKVSLFAGPKTACKSDRYLVFSNWNHAYNFAPKIFTLYPSKESLQIFRRHTPSFFNA